ncbi:MAG: IS630 family transposase, partial [Lentisphaeria bacterium]|nr:IS630 family transposase [Lentisphaeria bacterium]
MGRRIAWILGVHPSTASRHLAVLEPEIAVATGPRGPRLPLTPEQQCALIAFYCQSTPPAGIQRWTLRTAAEAINAAPGILGRTVHPATIARVLNRHHLRPHRNSYFLHIRDPFFFEKMHHILGVYAKRSDHVFCFDECPNIQALNRSGPDAPHTDGSRSREFVYKRNGTVDLFGFLQVSTGEVRPYCRPTHETKTLIEVFSDHVRSQPESEQIHYICDNLSPHFNEKFCRAVAQLSDRPCPPARALATAEERRQWLQNEEKRIVVHFLPFHGSWLNQVEVWFGLLRRYTLDGSWFESVEALMEGILAFADTWNTQLAHP